MNLKKALELRKAKYLKRWKGRDGKWHYQYSKVNTKAAKRRRMRGKQSYQAAAIENDERVKRNFKKDIEQATKDPHDIVSAQEDVLRRYTNIHPTINFKKIFKEMYEEKLSKEQMIEARNFLPVGTFHEVSKKEVNKMTDAEVLEYFTDEDIAKIKAGKINELYEGMYDE